MKCFSLKIWADKWLYSKNIYTWLYELGEDSEYDTISISSYQQIPRLRMNMIYVFIYQLYNYTILVIFHSSSNNNIFTQQLMILRRQPNKIKPNHEQSIYIMICIFPTTYTHDIISSVVTSSNIFTIHSIYR